MSKVGCKCEEKKTYKAKYFLPSVKNSLHQYSINNFVESGEKFLKSSF